MLQSSALHLITTSPITSSHYDSIVADRAEHEPRMLTHGSPCSNAHANTALCSHESSQTGRINLARRASRLSGVIGTAAS